MIFVDTSAWFAAVVPSDPDHEILSQWFNQNTETLLTTDYIIDETLTLLRMRKERLRSIALGEAFFSGKLTQIYYLTPDDIKQTWQIFEKFSDKNWSFTDCSSKWIIEKLKIKKTLTLDHHFQQFGSVLVLP
ncbi:MAG: PIN domain-containing protein [Crocosphaera sp.]|nr:PIN domain-containing protein [Crocosphaera sp.]